MILTLLHCLLDPPHCTNRSQVVDFFPLVVYSMQEFFGVLWK